MLIVNIEAVLIGDLMGSDRIRSKHVKMFFCLFKGYFWVYVV